MANHLYISLGVLDRILNPTPRKIGVLAYNSMDYENYLMEYDNGFDTYRKLINPMHGRGYMFDELVETSLFRTRPDAYRMRDVVRPCVRSRKNNTHI